MCANVVRTWQQSWLIPFIPTGLGLLFLDSWFDEFKLVSPWVLGKLATVTHLEVDLHQTSTWNKKSINVQCTKSSSNLYVLEFHAKFGESVNRPWNLPLAESPSSCHPPQTAWPWWWPRSGRWNLHSWPGSLAHPPWRARRKRTQNHSAVDLPKDNSHTHRYIYIYVCIYIYVYIYIFRLIQVRIPVSSNVMLYYWRPMAAVYFTASPGLLNGLHLQLVCVLCDGFDQGDDTLSSRIFLVVLADLWWLHSPWIATRSLQQACLSPRNNLQAKYTPIITYIL